MGLLKRLFPRPPSPAVADTKAATAPSTESRDGGVSVPPGHAVTVCHVAPVPDVQRLAGGAVIAQLGTSSDEYLEELQQVSEKVDDLLDWYGASPQFGSALPVYPDITSLLQTADDLHMDRQTLAWAHLLPRELFAWVEHKLFCGVALNVYKDRNSPLYALLSQPHVAELGRGRIPDALW